MTVTDTVAAVAPEVAEIREQLDRIPADWRNDALEASAVRRASMQALSRVLGERAAMAEVSEHVVLDALASASGGDPAGVDELIDAQLRKDAAGRLRERLVIPPIDAAGLALAFEIATAALKASDASIHVPAVAYDAEMVEWRQLCRQRGHAYEPPQATDLCRAASKKAALVGAESEHALAWHRSWLEWVAAPNADSLNLLAAAGGAIEQRANLAARVTAATKVIAAANDARRRAGLTWTPETAVQS